jgi:hypothetical protein
MTSHFFYSGRRVVRGRVAVAAVMVILVLGGCGREAPRPAPATEPARDGFAVLVFTRTTAYRHASIDDGVAAIRQLGWPFEQPAKGTLRPWFVPPYYGEEGVADLHPS